MRMSGSVGAPNPDCGDMTVRSRLGGVSNPGFGGSESEKLLWEGGGSALPEFRGKNKRQGGLLETSPLKVRFSEPNARRDRYTSQTLKSVSGVTPSTGIPKSLVRIRSGRRWRLQSWGAGSRCACHSDSPSGVPASRCPPPGPAALTWSSAGSSGSGSRGGGRCVSLRVGK